MQMYPIRRWVAVVALRARGHKYVTRLLSSIWFCLVGSQEREDKPDVMLHKFLIDIFPVTVSSTTPVPPLALSLSLTCGCPSLATTDTDTTGLMMRPKSAACIARGARTCTFLRYHACARSPPTG